MAKKNNIGKALGVNKYRKIPDGWSMVELSKLVEKVGSGITPTGGEKVYKLKGRPFLRSQNVGWGSLLLDDVAFINEDTHKSFKSTELKINDVLLNITGASIGRSSIVDERVIGGNVNQHVCIIRTDKKKLNPHFLNLFLLSQRGQHLINSYQAGGNRQGLNFEQIRSFKIPLPPVDEQALIANILRVWDKAILDHTRLISQKELSKKWLMQGLLSGNKRLRGFNGTWKEYLIEEVFDFVATTSFSRDCLTSDTTKGHIYCIHYGDIHATYENDHLDIKNEKRVPILKAEFENGGFRFLKEGDLIIADASEDYDGVGECVEVTNVGRAKIIGGLHTIVLRDKKKGFTTLGFKGHYFNNTLILNTLRRLSTGTSVYSISKSSLESVRIKVPTPAEQSAITNILNSADKEIQFWKRKLSLIEEQKKGLMQLLLTGKKRIKI